MKILGAPWLWLMTVGLCLVKGNPPALSNYNNSNQPILLYPNIKY